MHLKLQCDSTEVANITLYFQIEGSSDVLDKSKTNPVYYWYTRISDDINGIAEFRVSRGDSE